MSTQCVCPPHVHTVCVCVLLSHVLEKVLVFCSLWTVIFTTDCITKTLLSEIKFGVDQSRGVCPPAHPYMCPAHGQKEEWVGVPQAWHREDLRTVFCVQHGRTRRRLD